MYLKNVNYIRDQKHYIHRQCSFMYRQPARLYNRPLLNNYRIAAMKIELIYLKTWAENHNIMVFILLFMASLIQNISQKWISFKLIILFFRLSDFLAITKLIGLFHSLICDPVKLACTACIAVQYNLRFNLKPHFVNINDQKNLPG